MKKKSFFPRRIPEPKIMGEAEMRAFENLSAKNYKRWLIPLVDDVLGYCKKKNAAILDVGCGPGLLTKEFALRSRKFFVTGIDISRVAIRMAKKNCAGLPNTSFFVGNANSMPFLSNSFDVVVCKDTLHHFNNSKIAIREMVRVAKKDGIVYVQDLRRDVPWYLLKRVIPRNNTMEKLIYYSTRAAYTKEEIRKAIHSLHIKRFHIKTRKVTKKMTRKYQKNIDIPLLRQGFVSRYALAIKKKEHHAVP